MSIRSLQAEGTSRPAHSPAPPTPGGPGAPDALRDGVWAARPPPAGASSHREAVARALDGPASSLAALLSSPHASALSSVALPGGTGAFADWQALAAAGPASPGAAAAADAGAACWAVSLLRRGPAGDPALFVSVLLSSEAPSCAAAASRPHAGAALGLRPWASAAQSAREREEMQLLRDFADATRSLAERRRSQGRAQAERAAALRLAQRRFLASVAHEARRALSDDANPLLPNPPRAHTGRARALLLLCAVSVISPS